MNDRVAPVEVDMSTLTGPTLYEQKTTGERATAPQADISAKLDALLLANGIDPQIVEEGDIEAVKRSIGRSS